MESVLKVGGACEVVVSDTAHLGRIETRIPAWFCVSMMVAVAHAAGRLTVSLRRRSRSAAGWRSEI